MLSKSWFVCQLLVFVTRLPVELRHWYSENKKFYLNESNLHNSCEFTDDPTRVAKYWLESTWNLEVLILLWGFFILIPKSIAPVYAASICMCMGLLNLKPMSDFNTSKLILKMTSSPTLNSCWYKLIDTDDSDILPTKLEIFIDSTGEVMIGTVLLMQLVRKLWPILLRDPIGHCSSIPL